LKLKVLKVVSLVVSLCDAGTCRATGGCEWAYAFVRRYLWALNASRWMVGRVSSSLANQLEQKVSPILEFLNPIWIERAYIQVSNFVTTYLHMSL
jgi:hypothetical protein